MRRVQVKTKHDKVDEDNIIFACELFRDGLITTKSVRGQAKDQSYSLGLRAPDSRTQDQTLRPWPHTDKVPKVATLLAYLAGKHPKHDNKKKWQVVLDERKLTTPGVKPMLGNAAEAVMQRVVVLMARSGQPIRVDELKTVARATAMQMGLENNKGQPYDDDSNMDKWLRGFRQRMPPDLKLKAREGYLMSQQRVFASTRERVQHFADEVRRMCVVVDRRWGVPASSATSKAIAVGQQ